MRTAYWPRDTIRAMLDQARSEGEAKAKLPSADDANRFRFAIYNFLRAEQSEEKDEFSISVADDGTITVTLKPKIQIL